MSFIQLVSQPYPPPGPPASVPHGDLSSGRWQSVVPESSLGCEAASSLVPYSKHPSYNPSSLLLKSQPSQSSSQVLPCSKIFSNSSSPGGQNPGASAKWMRICLPMHGTQVRSPAWEGSTRSRATNPVHRNYRARMLQLLKPVCLEPILCNQRSHLNEKLVHCNKREALTLRQRKPACGSEDPAQPIDK